jgi:hypothetical protein
VAPKNDRSLERLENAAIEVWEDFEVDLLEKLVCSMKHRLQAIIDTKGWYTKY